MGLCLVSNKVILQHIIPLLPSAAATNTKQVLSETDFLSQCCCGVQYHSEDNNNMQSGTTHSPDGKLKSESVALLFGFLYVQEMVKLNKAN